MFVHVVMISISLSWFRFNDVLFNSVALCLLYSCYMSLRKTSCLIYLGILCINPLQGALYFYMMSLMNLILFIIFSIMNFYLGTRLYLALKRLITEDPNNPDFVEYLLGGVSDITGGLSVDDMKKMGSNLKDYGGKAVEMA